MYNRLFKYLTANEILYKKQFDFREGHSTEHAVIHSLLNSVPNVPYVPYVTMRPTCSTCPRAQVCFTGRKIKNIGFNEIK